MLQEYFFAPTRPFAIFIIVLPRVTDLLISCEINEHKIFYLLIGIFIAFTSFTNSTIVNTSIKILSPAPK